MSKGMVVAISGPSGVGKGTLLRAVENKLEGTGDVAHSISVTTRPPRGGETEGVEYYFRTREEFEKLIEEGDIVEYDIYLNNYYGTPAAPLSKMIEEGKDVLLDITIEGSLALKKKFGEDAVTVFIVPPSTEELEDRLRRRGTEDEELVKKRLEQAEVEMARAGEFEFIVRNGDVDTASDEILDILNRQKAKRNK